MQGCSELIWDLWMKSSELLPSIVILWKLKAHHVWVSSLFPRRGHFADQDWCKKGNQCRKNRKVKSALAKASVRVLRSLLGCWKRNLFLSALGKKDVQSKTVRIYFIGLHYPAAFIGVGDVHFNDPASERVPLSRRSSSWWSVSKCFFWWLLRGLKKKLQTSS